MSLAIDLTTCQQRLAVACIQASAEARKLKSVAPAAVYEELMLQLCIFAAESNALKALLGSLRMMGEMEQRPPPVTAEMLELATCVRASDLIDRIDESERTRKAFAHELEMIGDDTMEPGRDDQNVLVNAKQEGGEHGQH